MTVRATPGEAGHEERGIDRPSVSALGGEFTSRSGYTPDDIDDRAESLLSRGD